MNYHEKRSFVPHTKLQDNYDILIMHYMEWINADLADCSRAFDGDLIEMAVLNVIGLIFIRHSSAPTAQDYGFDREELTVSAARISKITALPRETVRRKLKALKERGWVEQVQGGKWKFVMDGETSVASRELMPLQIRSLTRMMNLVDALSNDKIKS
jgi:hypothetical protein